MALLTSIQHRADHLVPGINFFGEVRWMSNLLELNNGTLGYAYSGYQDGPPTPSASELSHNREIYFRTYDPIPQTFTTPITVEPLENYNVPRGNGLGGVVHGSFWDYPQLLKLTDGTLLCIYSKSGMTRDSPSFAPTDATLYGGGIYVRESTDHGATWSSQTLVAGLAYGLGPAATDGTNVWIWGVYNGQVTVAGVSPFVTFGHYTSPVFTTNMYSRTSPGTWASHLVYTANVTTRSTGPTTGNTDGLDLTGAPLESAFLVNANVGFALGVRWGTSLASNPLAGPGSLGKIVGNAPKFNAPVMCWRTTDGGTTWIESQVGTLAVDITDGAATGCAFRVKQTPDGRLYVIYKRATSIPNVAPITPAAFYSDDDGATWTDVGQVSPSVFVSNPDTGGVLEYQGTNGSTNIALSVLGTAYVNSQTNDNVVGQTAIAVFKSTSPVDDDPSTYEYFGYLDMPTDRVFGGDKMGSSVFYEADQHIYILEQFIDDTSGLQELWIIGYPPEEEDEEPEPEVPESTRMFRRGVIQAQRGRFSAGRKAPGSFSTWRKL